MSNPTGKVAVLTGASRGVGAAIAKALAAAGAVQGDVSKPAGVRCLFAETERQLGPLDAVAGQEFVQQPPDFRCYCKVFVGRR